MPEKGKMSQWEREDNRKKIFLTLLEKSLNFTELLETTSFARSTLSQHLKDLQREKVIEKAIEEGKVVYRSTLDEEKLISEFKKLNFDFLMNVLSKISPELTRLLKLMMRLQVNSIILRGKRRIEGKPPLTAEELVALETPRLLEMVELYQKIHLESQKIQDFSKKYYDSEKQTFNARFWKAMSKISFEELQRR